MSNAESLEEILSKEKQTFIYYKIKSCFLEKSHSLAEELVYFAPENDYSKLICDNNDILEEFNKIADLWQIVAINDIKLENLDLLKIEAFNSYINEGRTLQANVFCSKNYDIKHINFSILD